MAGKTSQRLTTGALGSAFFITQHRQLILGCITALWLSYPGTVRADCHADHFDATVKVDHVYDGDTLRLADGRKLRLIGINTPEIRHHGRPSEPLAREARQALISRLSGPVIHLLYDQERYDRYRRVLAHVYSPAGESIQAWLLSQGYATTLVVPPNLINRACYRQAQSKASAPCCFSARRSTPWALRRFLMA